MRSLSLLALAALALALVTGAEADEKKEPAAGPRISLQSAYFPQRIATAHQIRVVGHLGGKAQLTLDANTCTLSPFGDPTTCTEMAALPIEVTLVHWRLDDPSGRGRRLYRLSGALPKGYKFYLVVPRHRSEPHRLILGHGMGPRHVVTLEPLPEPPKKPVAKGSLCKTARYTAVQSGGEVTIRARGENNTAGWKVSFERLPIRIWPPQHKLVCIAPTLPVPQIISPYVVTVSFKASMRVPQVIVHDARGANRVPVRLKAGR